MDRKQTTFNGLRVAYWEGGSGEPLLLIHGSGPGASTLGNWRLVLDELARDFHVIAPDLIGFGQSDRKPEAPYFDLDLWAVKPRQRWICLTAPGSTSWGIPFPATWPCGWPARMRACAPS